MNKSAVLGTVFGIGVAAAAASIAGYVTYDRNEADSLAAEQTMAAQDCY